MFSSVSLNYVPSRDVLESPGLLMTFASIAATKIYHPEHGYESTLKHVEDSLAKFQFGESRPALLHTYHTYSLSCLTFYWIAYIDLYLIHSPLSGREKRLETYRALLKKRDEGAIRSIGVSN